MKLLTPLVSLSIVAGLVVGLPGATARMPIDDVRAGMTGVGITVFEGTAREEFGVEILGVLRNVMGPRRDIIVARLSGGPLAETGVIQGMSGSPVYIDERLVGAVSYALGSFPKEPIAGITPIDEMVAADGNPINVARVDPGGMTFPVTAGGLADLVRQTVLPPRPFAALPTDVKAIGLPVADGGRLGTLLRPITTPVVFNGFAPEVHDLWSTAFATAGFATAVGGAQSVESGGTGPLQPGDPVGAVLISGDLTMAGTGTVTMVEDGRVYAFGHPFYNLGPVGFPMTRASVTTVLPSLALSSKIASIGEVVGTLDQDRSTGVFGSLGPGPATIPVTVRLSAPTRGLGETVRFRVIEDRLFSPVLMYTGVLSTFFSWTRELGVATYEVTGRTHITDHASVTFQDVFSGNGAFLGVASAFASPLAALLNNDISPVRVEGIEIDITSREEPRTATIERVWFDARRIRAGDVVELNILARTYRGAEVVESLEVEIPRNATGTLQLAVSDAGHARLRELQRGASQLPDSVDQLIETLNKMPRNNRFYVTLTSRQPGAVVRGATMPALPASVLAVLESDQSGSGLRRLGHATLAEWQVPTDYAVSGSRTLAVTVEGG